MCEITTIGTCFEILSHTYIQYVCGDILTKDKSNLPEYSVGHILKFESLYREHNQPT